MHLKFFIFYFFIFLCSFQNLDAQDYNVRDFGAKGDGITDDSQAVWTAFEAANKSNGGRVIFDFGYTFLTGGFNVTSNIILDIRGTILASINVSSYGILTKNINPWQYYEGKQPIVYINNATNITIRGGGVLDGNGPYWYACKYNQTEPPCYPFGAPRLLMPVYTTNLTIENITLKDSPQWTLHLAYTTNVYINNISIIGPAGTIVTRGVGINNDGIDIDCSVNVTVENSYINIGDDAISIKSGYAENGVTYGRPTENVIVRNLTVGTSNGISMGSEMSCGARNITFQDISINGSFRGINVKTGVGQGGLLKDITYSNIQILNTNISIQLTARVTNSRNLTMPIPNVTDIVLSNIIADNVEYAYVIEGISAENPLRNIYFHNINITNIRKSFSESCEFITGICDNSTVFPYCPPCLTVENCFDANSDCTQYLGFCNVNTYHDLLCDQCRKSCNLCNSC